MTEPVVWFADADCLDVGVAGGKGASLAAMAASGLRVPPGFVVRAGALEDAVDGERLRALAEAGDHEAAQALVLEAAPPRDAVARAYARLGGLVAVRSSACAEDSSEASFAGQHETFLGVSGADAVCARVVECWASFFSERALFYRASKGSPSDLRIGVVVQEMVQAEKSGVLFTVDPVARRRDRMLLEAVFGLGEQVVSGEVTPDHYLVDRRGDVKVERLVHGGVLGQDEVRELVELGARLEEHLGAPQDIEWAIADEQLFVLQSRPVTTL